MRTTGVVALAFVAGFAGALIAIAMVSWALDSKRVLGATWWEAFTALGTVGAVVAALAIAGVQHWLKMRANRREPLCALSTVIERGGFLIGRIPKTGPSSSFVENFFQSEVSVNALDDVRRTLEAFPLGRLTDPQAINASFEMRDALEMAARSVNAIFPMNDGKWHLRWEKSKPSLAHAEARADCAQATMNVACDGAGIPRSIT